MAGPGLTELEEVSQALRESLRTNREALHAVSALSTQLSVLFLVVAEVVRSLDADRRDAIINLLRKPLSKGIPETDRAQMANVRKQLVELILKEASPLAN